VTGNFHVARQRQLMDRVNRPLAIDPRLMCATSDTPTTMSNPPLLELTTTSSPTSVPLAGLVGEPGASSANVMTWLSAHRSRPISSTAASWSSRYAGQPPGVLETAEWVYRPFCTVDSGGERLVCLSREDLGERAPLPGPGEGLMPRRVLSLEDWFISTASCRPRSAVTGRTVRR